LGELVDVCSGRDYKHLSEGTIPVYGTGGYMLSVNDALSYDRDAIGIGRKGTIDRPYILKAPFWTVDTLFYAIPREKVDLNFAFDIFQNIDWKKKDESTGVPSLSKTAINDIDVLAPKHDEQQTIGQFFAALDDLITLHQRKLGAINLTNAIVLFDNGYNPALACELIILKGVLTYAKHHYQKRHVILRLL
jgi:type I restriction enzyme S subunit